jgi:hypothetical protein
MVALDVLVNDATLHHKDHTPDRCYILQRIAVERDHVRFKTRSNRAYWSAHAERFGSDDKGRAGYLNDKRSAQARIRLNELL